VTRRPLPHHRHEVLPLFLCASLLLAPPTRDVAKPASIFLAKGGNPVYDDPARDSLGAEEDLAQELQDVRHAFPGETAGPLGFRSGRRFSSKLTAIPKTFKHPASPGIGLDMITSRPRWYHYPPRSRSL
jgi:hypothetical protein